ncbi:MAG: hypothetical protein OXB88_06345 [Bacteriovoracales bacterium]|nr:hypothetical protein [Bacteriovoracales bacterium]
MKTIVIDEKIKDKLRRIIHDIRSNLGSSFLTIETVHKNYESDPTYCKEMLDAALEDKESGFEALKALEEIISEWRKSE